jgi:hypothetical protein
MAAPPQVAHRLETKKMDLPFRVANRNSWEKDPGDTENASCLPRTDASWAERLFVKLFSEVFAVVASTLFASRMSGDDHDVI